MLKIGGFDLCCFENDTDKITELQRTQNWPFRWTAPEVLQHNKVSRYAFSKFCKLTFKRASDVWSFGVVMWEILEGKQPYYGLTNPEVVEHVCQKKLLLAKPSRFDYPPRLWQIMQQCWKWNAAERPSFEDLYKWFSEMESELKSTEVETTGQSSTQSKSTSSDAVYGNSTSIDQ